MSASGIMQRQRDVSETYLDALRAVIHRFIQIIKHIHPSNFNVARTEVSTWFLGHEGQASLQEAFEIIKATCQSVVLPHPCL
jgi:hypothetical protein